MNIDDNDAEVYMSLFKLEQLGLVNITQENGEMLIELSEEFKEDMFKQMEERMKKCLATEGACNSSDGAYCPVCTALNNEGIG
jgi:hypothetical protein